MCNLYSVTTNQQAIRDLAKAMRDIAGNLPPLPGIFPDYPAPIVRTGADGVRELARARWGMPSPAFVLQGKKVDKGVTNVRNVASRVGAVGWRPLRAASSRSRASARTPVDRTAAANRYGSRSTRAVHWHSSPESGPAKQAPGRWPSAR